MKDVSIAVVIIPLDLSGYVNDVLTHEISTLTTGNMEQLNALKTTSEAVAKVRDMKFLQKRAVVDNLQSLLNKIENLLIEAGDIGLSFEYIMGLIQPTITTTSAFTLRMKKYLREKGNDYVIERYRNNYMLKPYNLYHPLPSDGLD